MTIYMEDVNSIAGNAIDDIEEAFKEYGSIDLTEGQLDDIFDVLVLALEKAGNYPNYRNYN
jgi:hypothetical protein